MITILEFITARVEADEARARAAIESVREDTESDPGEWVASRTYSGAFSACVDIVDGGSSVVSDEGYPSYEQAVHIAAENPNATLRRCAGVRRAVDAAMNDLSGFDGVFGDGCTPSEIRTGKCSSGFDNVNGSAVLRALASFWSTHPEFQEAWKA